MSGEDGGVRSAAMRVGASALAVLRTRLELASVELAQERERAKISFALIAAAAVAFALLAVVVTFGIIAWFWDDHRYAAIVIVALAYALAGVAALVVHRRIRREAPAPFGATAEALRRDVEWLRARHPRARDTEGERAPGVNRERKHGDDRATSGRRRDGDTGGSA